MANFAKSIAASNFFFMPSKTETPSFDLIYTEHQGVVRSVIYQIAGGSQIDDLVQETFIKVWKSFESFNEHSKMSTWIYRIATNVAIDHLRSVRRKKETLDQDFDALVDLKNSADEDLSNHQLVELGLKSLSDDHRIVLVLAYLHERSIGEIAETLNLSEGTVKSRLHYAREAISQFLQSKGAQL